MSRKSLYFTVPAVAVAATAGAGSANAATYIDYFDYSVSSIGQSKDVVIGSQFGNTTAQYTFSKPALFTGKIASADGVSRVNSNDTAAIGLPGETYYNWVLTSGDSFYHLKFDLNGTTTYGYAKVEDGTTLAKVVYDVPAVPEPATWALAILGFGLAGAAMRRRQGVLATA